MDPVTLTAVSLAATAASGAVGAAGSIMGGQSQAAMYNYQAGVAQINKQIEDQNAEYAVAAGEVEAQQSGMKTRYTVGQTRAQQGAGGLAVGSGSNARVVDSEMEIGADEQAQIRSNAARTAYGYEVAGVTQQAQVGLDQMAASNAKTAGDLSAFQSILGSAGSVSSKWSQASNAGVFGSSNSSGILVGPAALGLASF